MIKVSISPIKTLFSVILAACYISLFAHLVFAGPTSSSRVFENQRKFIIDEYIRQLRKTEIGGSLGEEEKYKFYYGLVLGNLFEFYENLDNNKDAKDDLSSVLTQEIRLWGKLLFWEKSFAYVRVKDSYSSSKNVTDYDENSGGGDNQGPDLEMGYLSFNSEKYSLDLGRQFFSVGRGIAYSNINDGILFQSSSVDWVFKGFLAHSLAHEDNIDYSIPEYDKEGNSRSFVGLEAGYTGMRTSALYAFCLIQKDHSTPPTQDNNQKYQYDSQYFGLGFTNKKYNLSSWGEVIKETGHSYTDSSGGGPMERKPIDAWAAIAGMRYDTYAHFQPATEVEIAYGSGNSSRSSVTNTYNGGNTNSKDTNFLYFGGYYGGYALSPNLSNLFITKIDQSFKPLYFLNPVKDITLGVKYYLYFKDKKNGGISDTDATVKKRFVGSEFDTYFYWQISPSFDFIVRYGIFFPGDAYPENANSNAKYLFSRLQFTF